MSHGYWKCMFVGFLVGYKGPPKSCSLLSVKYTQYHIHCHMVVYVTYGNILDDTSYE